jgi:hypothetical protein
MSDYDDSSDDDGEWLDQHLWSIDIDGDQDDDYKPALWSEVTLLMVWMHFCWKSQGKKLPSLPVD